MVGLCNDPLTSLLNSRFECVPIHSRVQFCFHGNLGIITDRFQNQIHKGVLVTGIIEVLFPSTGFIVLVDRKYEPDLVVMEETTRFNVVIDEISKG